MFHGLQTIKFSSKIFVDRCAELLVTEPVVWAETCNAFLALFRAPQKSL